MSVGEAQGGLRAGGETLLDSGVGERGVAHQRGGASGLDAYLRRSLVGPVQQSDDRRIVTRHDGSARLRNAALHGEVGLGRGQHTQFDGVGGHRASRRCAPGDGGAGYHGAERPAHARGGFRQGEAQAAQRAAAFGAEQLRVRGRQSGALKLDIEVVLDGQRQRILKREVEVAGADGLVDPRRVPEAILGRGQAWARAQKRGKQDADT